VPVVVFPAAVVVSSQPRLRLRLKPKAPTTVDGGWWPRSRDLAAELPSLLSVLAVRLGRIERVGYHIGEWVATLHKISFGGGARRPRRPRTRC
jgi:hypothetical protein